MSCRAVRQSDVDWYKARYPDESDDIERWKASGEIVIVDEQENKNANKHRKKRQGRDTREGHTPCNY